MDKAQAQYNWSGVIDFLISQCRQETTKESEWALEKKDLQEQVVGLEAKLKAQEGLNADLVKRVKMLEVCLKRERMKFVAYLSKTNAEEREQILSELRKTDAETIPKRAEAEMAESRPDLELTKRRARRQRAFLEKVLNEFDCGDILEEVKRYDEDATLDINKDLNDEVQIRPSHQRGKPGLTNQSGTDKTGQGVSPSFKLKLHTEELKSIVVTGESSNKVVTCGNDGNIRLLDLDSLLNGEQERADIGKVNEDGLGIHVLASRGTLVFSGSAEGTVKAWEVKNSLHSNDSYDFHKDSITDLKIHPKENVLLTSSLDGLIRCIKFKSSGFIDKQSAPNFVLGHSQTPISLAWCSESKNTFAVGIQESSEVFIFDMSSPRPIQTIVVDSSTNCSVRKLSLIPGEPNTLMAATEAGWVAQLSLSTGKIIQKFEAHQGAVSCLTISLNGTRVCTAGADGFVRLWERKKGKKILEFSAHRRKQDEVINGMVLLEDQQYILTGGADGEFCGFDISTQV